MAKLERKNFKVFGENAPLDEIGQFGSAKATTKKNTKDIEEIQELEAWSEGWGGAIISNKNYPPMEEMTGAMNVMSYQTAYTLQEGIPEWNKDTTYYKGSIVKNLEGEDVKLYQSISNDNLNNPLSNTDNWSEISFGGSGLEVCDIGMALYVDETQGKRRYLNGQIVDINKNTQAFLDRLKEIHTTNPDYFTTEDNWQAEKLLSPNGYVDKFVIADDESTVRLPNYPDYIISELSDTIPAMGNGIAVGLDNSKGKFGLITSWSGEPVNDSDGYLGMYSKNYGTSVGSTGTGTWGQENWFATGITTDSSKSGIIGDTSNLAGKLKLRYFIQIATGSETKNNIVNDIELNNPYSLFDSKYSDHELNNLSWLRSEGQWNAKATYPTAYDKLLKVYNGTETVEGLSVKLHTDTSATDYDFRINTADETFRLPLKTKLASGKAVVGNGMTLGLTDGTNNYGLGITNLSDGRLHPWGNLYGANVGSTTFSGTNPATSTGITTDPTKSGIELSDSGLYLYYYVGETVQNANLIDAGRIGEQLANCITRNDCKAYVTETYQNGASWYRVYSDGWCEQGGYMSRGDITISLLKGYKDTNYYINAMPKATNGGYPATYETYFSKVTTTSFYIAHQGIGGGTGSLLGYNWKTSGYIR